MDPRDLPPPDRWFKKAAVLLPKTTTKVVVVDFFPPNNHNDIKAYTLKVFFYTQGATEYRILFFFFSRAGSDGGQAEEAGGHFCPGPRHCRMPP